MKIGPNRKKNIPDHWCTPPEDLSPEALNITFDQWRSSFLPQELGPDYQMRPSQCSMYSVSQDNLPKFLSGELPGNDSEGLEKIQCKDAGGWSYDQR